MPLAFKPYPPPVPLLSFSLFKKIGPSSAEPFARFYRADILRALPSSGGTGLRKTSSPFGHARDLEAQLTPQRWGTMGIIGFGDHQIPP